MWQLTGHVGFCFAYVLFLYQLKLFILYLFFAAAFLPSIFIVYLDLCLTAAAITFV